MINYIQESDRFYKIKGNLGLLQCNSMYPTPDIDTNLKTISRFKELFPNTTIGYSDHSIGSTACEVALSLGAEILEVHFTDTRDGKTFRDHLISYTKEEINQLKEKSIRILDMLGNYKKTKTRSEIESGHPSSFRRAVYLTKDLTTGHIISKDDLCFLRPCHGIPSKDWKKIIGKKLKCDHKRLQQLDENMFI